MTSKLVGSIQKAAKNMDPQNTKCTAWEARAGKGLCLNSATSSRFWLNLINALATSLPSFGRWPPEICSFLTWWQAQFIGIHHFSIHVVSKVRSCYRVFIPSNPAARYFFIRSKNNNKIARKWDCWVCQILQFTSKRPNSLVLKLKLISKVR